jgi:hypothetical protein
VATKNLRTNQPRPRHCVKAIIIPINESDHQHRFDRTGGQQVVPEFFIIVNWESFPERKPRVVLQATTSGTPFSDQVATMAGRSG